MSVDMSEKLKKAVVKAAFCGIVGAGFANTGMSMYEFSKDVKENVPEKVIGPDGHAGAKLTDKQESLMLSGVLSGTVASCVGAFGWLLRRQDKKEKAMQAAMMAAKQNSK